MSRLSDKLKDSGVSSVIGVILIVAVTVGITAVATVIFVDLSNNDIDDPN